LVRGARRSRRREDGGRMLIQTFLPDHDVITAAVRADPGRMTDGVQTRRQLLELPPYAALAAVSGSGSASIVEQLRADGRVRVGGEDPTLVRAPGWDTLGDALSAIERTRGDRVRIAVDPPRV
jgi:primosomal protein N' (replication factor Y)